jgi:pyridoxine 5-phosphate synthase
MIKKRLGVNIDHVATIRNARGEKYPDPAKVALIAQNSGANSITIHLREDRRHIRDYDLKNIKKKVKIPINLEIALTKEMISIAKKYRPSSVCFVPEKRKELTTEGGLNIKKNTAYMKNAIKSLQKNNIKVSLFIEPKISDVLIAKKIKANSVELHTGKFCRLFNNKKNYKNEIIKISKAANYANQVGLHVHAGHGLTYKSIKKICKIKTITEYNIGHYIISASIFTGISYSIKKFKKIINK